MQETGHWRKGNPVFFVTGPTGRRFCGHSGGYNSLFRGQLQLFHRNNPSFLVSSLQKLLLTAFIVCLFRHFNIKTSNNNNLPPPE